MAGNQTDNLMLLDLTTGLPRTPETGGTPDTIQLSTDVELISGANMLIDGDLTVNGTTTTIHSEVVNITDNHLDLNADYTTTVAQTGGIVVNVLPTSTADAVGGVFTAGVAATSNPTVVTTGSGTFAAGDVIQIAGADDQSNDGIYEVLSHVGTLLTIRVVGTVGTTQDWVQNDFVADTVVAGDIRIVNVNVMRGTSTGSWETAVTTTTTGLTYNTITQQGVVDLQEAYVQGNTITTSAGEGNVTFAGTESFVVTTSGGIDLNTVLDADVTVFDVQMTGTNGFSIDGTAASNVSVTAGDLTLSTITSGALIGTSAAGIDLNAATTVTVDTADAADASGNDITLTAGTSTAGTADGASIILTPGDGDTTGTAGFVNITSPADQGEILLQIESTGTGANAVGFFTGTGAPSGVVTADAGSLYLRDTGTGGEVYVNTSTGSGTSWTLLAAGGGNSLQAAYAVGNTIVTNSTDGDFDVSGSEAISLDASAASNFTVASAGLTLSTTTSGTLLVSSAGLVDIDAAANLDVDVTGTMDFLSTGAFSIDGTGASNVTATSGNLTLSTATTGNVTLTPAGSLIFDYATWPAADGSSGQVLETDGAGALSWATGGSGGSAWSEETAQTTDATAGVTIATPIPTVTDGTQHSVEVLISAESGGANTYFRRQVFTFYRDGGGSVHWTTEINGVEARRGLGAGVTATLSVSGNAVLVTVTGQAATTIDWTTQYRTTNTITSGGVVSTTGIVRETFDNRGSATTTGSASGSGGTVDFTIAAGAAYVTMQYLRVKNASGTCADATIQFFRDAGRTDEIYDAQNKDTSTANGWVDRNPSTMMGDDGTGLASNIMYGRITNNDAGAATFDVEAVLWGVV